MSDEMSQREKRMQRHQAERSKDRPKQVARTYGIWLIALLVLAGAAYGVYVASTSGQACPGHWHATFAVYVPGANGQPQRIDMASPVSPNGVPYYDLSGAAGMGLAVHMHQSANSMETGSSALGPVQWHFEQDGTCVGVRAALHAIEIDATASSLHLYGGHAQVHQDGTWTANATARLRFFVETKANGNWTWQERTFDQVKAYQLPDGSSLLVALGNYTDAQIKQMETTLPAPVSRT